MRVFQFILILCFPLLSLADSSFIAKILKSTNDKQSYEEIWSQEKAVKAIFDPEEKQIQLDLQTTVNIEEFPFKEYAYLKVAKHEGHAPFSHLIAAPEKGLIFEVVKGGAISRVYIVSKFRSKRMLPLGEIYKKFDPEVVK